MFRHYLKIAFRALLRKQTYTLLNIGGLAVGLASAILIFLWVADEYAYDKFHANYDRIYQLYQSQEWNMGHIGTGQSMPYPLLEVLPDKASQVEYISLVNWGEGNLLQVGEKRMTEFGYSVSEDFLKMFSFTLIKGDQQHALDEPTSIVITESTAKSLFGDIDPLGQVIRIDNNREQKVTGVIADFPKQSQFEFDYLLPFSFFEATNSWVKRAKAGWDNNSFQMFVQLREGASEAETNEAIRTIVKDNNPKSPTAKLFLHPMSKWRLHAHFEEGVNTGGRIDYVRLFTAIAVFVLIIACINFMNLATARSESRAKEVGIRKSIGSRRRELIAQFMGESLAITFLAFALAIALVELALPAYHLLVDKNVSIDYTNPVAWSLAIGLILLVGLFTGSYPAFYLSSFEPVKVLKGKINSAKGGSAPRKVLVVLQFACSIFLIIGTIVVYQQIMHVKDRDMGYDRENLIQVWTNGELETNFQTIREELVRTGAVTSVCKSNSPVTTIFSTNEVKWQGMPTDSRVAFSTIATEYDYSKTMGVKMIKGRDFSPDFPSDSSAVVINEAAWKMIGFEDPIGQKVEWIGTSYEIIGVMQDMVMAEATSVVQPLSMFLIPGWTSTITLRLNKTHDLPGALAQVESVFKKYNPNYPFEYRFTDELFNQKFANINLISRVAGIFAGLAIAITALGLLGLAAFTAEQRTKELGIRKVLGASVTGLIFLLARDFTRLVLIAFVIASGFAWWGVDQFLMRYEYRINFQYWVPVAVGAFALALTLMIVGTQAMRAALMNPTKSLRTE
ncbi:MAG: ABC transporter permease [Cyclobacteriaceae bacterium]|jgi:predicted permease|nr:ABC transporter permease [Cyclobacteriaceae bacterium]